MDSFDLDRYLQQLDSTYVTTGTLLHTANVFLSQFSADEQKEWMRKTEGKEEEEEEEDDEKEADDEGWKEVKRRKVNPRSLMAAAPMASKEKAHKKDPLLEKHSKKDFYAFQVTDRWRKKAERIASRMGQQRDYFGRLRQVRNFQKKT